jgi:hypothetical protein
VTVDLLLLRISLSQDDRDNPLTQTRELWRIHPTDAWLSEGLHLNR